MKKRILLVTDHIGQDGTGRFITYLANGLSFFDDLEVVLLVFHDENYAFDSDIMESIHIEKMKLKKRTRYSLSKIVRRIIEINPSVCFVLYTQLLYLSLFSGPIKHKGIKLVFRETIIPSIFRKNLNPISKWICRFSYRKYDQIIAQSNDMSNDLITKWNVNPKSIRVINNPISIDKITNAINACSRPEDMPKDELPVFISAGRLCEQKGYDIILKRIAELSPNIPFKYYILGDGEKKNELQEIIDKNKISEYVKLLGFKHNAYCYLFYSDGLILSSRYEGFPNIVLESNALGKPVFANFCLGGINEIIIDGKNGVYCNFENHFDFKKGLERFMNTNFNAKFIKDITLSRYNYTTIMAEYKKFIDAL